VTHKNSPQSGGTTTLIGGHMLPPSGNVEFTGVNWFNLDELLATFTSLLLKHYHGKLGCISGFCMPKSGSC
jgi:hypothetical protein